MRAPFPYFGGKSRIAATVWEYLGQPKHYIEPFCGSAAVLLAAPNPCSLEVVNDRNCFIANFWRSVKHQSATVAEWSDYPVSHIDLGARHAWLLAQWPQVAEQLQDPNWPGDAKIAGWWLWGQCCWIGSGWCDQDKVPHISDAGRGTAGAAAHKWLGELSTRLDRVRIVCGDWSRCLNSHYGGKDTGVFLDPPYDGTEGLYGSGSVRVVDQVVDWCLANQDLKIVMCGHAGDYDLPGWRTMDWERGGLAYGGGTGKDAECLWVSPACEDPTRQMGLFA